MGPGMDGMRGAHGMRGMRGHRGGMRGDMGGHIEWMSKELDLSERQKTQMSDLREAQERKMIGIRSGLEEAQLDLNKALRADEPSQAQIDAAIDRMSRLRGDAQKSRIASRLAVRNLLTDSQKKKLEKLREERRERRSEGAERSKGAPGKGADSGRRGA
jgi:Spy/CpxP family protein refolding chaperone